MDGSERRTNKSMEDIEFAYGWGKDHDGVGNSQQENEKNVIKEKLKL